MDKPVRASSSVAYIDECTESSLISIQRENIETLHAAAVGTRVCSLRKLERWYKKHTEITGRLRVNFY